MVLQIDQAAGLFSQTAQLGIVFGLLCAIVLVLGWLVVKLYKESKEKSAAHGKTLAIKDIKIEEISEARRQDSIDSIDFVRGVQDDIKNLVKSIDKLIDKFYENK